MEAQTLIDLIENDKPKLRDWFYEFDRQSNSINDWQKLLGYPLETYSCQICHKIRNNIMAGLSYWYGNNICKEPMKSIAKIYFDDAINYIKSGEPIRQELNNLYARISDLLYK